MANAYWELECTFSVWVHAWQSGRFFKGHGDKLEYEWSSWVATLKGSNSNSELSGQKAPAKTQSQNCEWVTFQYLKCGLPTRDGSVREKEGALKMRNFGGKSTVGWHSCTICIATNSTWFELLGGKVDGARGGHASLWERYMRIRDAWWQ